MIKDKYNNIGNPVTPLNILIITQLINVSKKKKITPQL